MRIATYIRVSTQEQAVEGYSIDAQQDRLKSYINAKGWTHVAEYIDPGFSGSNISRPKMQQLISDCKSGLFDGVLVYKLDRLSRSQKDTLFLIEDVFLKNNIEFVSLNENFDTSTPFGRAMIGILSVFAQLEREQIKERTRMGLEERAKQGLHHGKAPFGYRIVNGKLVIDNEESKVIKEIFSMLADGYTYGQIKNIIVDHYPQYKSFGETNNNKIKDIASSITYGGYVKFGDTVCKGSHPQIVDDITYKKAMNVLSQKAAEWGKYRTKRNGAHSNYLLTGFLFCGECGARYRVKQKTTPGTQPIYVCYSRYGSPAHMVKTKGCKSPYIGIGELDGVIFNELIRIKEDKSYFNSLRTSEKTINSEEHEKRYKSDIVKINAKINKLLDLYGEDGIDINVLTSKIKNLTEQKASIEQKLVDVQQKSAEIKMTHKEVVSALSQLDELIEKGAVNELRQLLQMLLDKVIVSNSGISIQWKFS